MPDRAETGGRSGGSGVAVTVAVLTYLRPADVHRCVVGVLSELESLTAVEPAAIRVLVVDNDPQGSAAEAVESIGSPLVRYVLEPTPGISAGRNRALDESSGSDVLVFIDDDEEPQPGWLGLLLHAWRDSGAAAVAGRVVSDFGGPVDPWIVAGEFFLRRTLPTGSPIDVAATNNLLLDLQQIRRLGLRFDPRFGLSGGGDTHFTRSVVQAGGAMTWCDEAVVTDHVPADRMTRSWVLFRSRRMGNTEVSVDIMLARSCLERLQRRITGALRGLIRIITGTVRHAVGRLTGSMRDQAKGMRTIWRGVGMLAGAGGVVVSEYGRNQGSATTSSEDGRVTADRPLVVLSSVTPPRPTTNPYVVMLDSSISAVAGVESHYFSWSRALLGRYQVFHAHWPEILFSGRPGPKKAVRQLLFTLIVLRLKMNHTPVVQTLHNAGPHEGASKPERAILSLLARQTAVAVRLNPTTQGGDRPVETVLHGHYKDWFATMDRPETDPGTILFVGLIREYKGVPALIQAFRKIDPALPPRLRLRVVGSPSTPELGRALSALAAGDDRISLHLRYVDDAELATELGRAELVVLPYVDMHNSGSTLMALSLGRPVLLPDNGVNRSLSDEVGPGWVHLYQGPLTSDCLATAMAEVRSTTRGSEPDLSRREWDQAGHAHVGIYRRAIQIARSGRAAGTRHAQMSGYV